MPGSRSVSIPQAVSTVATLDNNVILATKMAVSIPQAVSTVATDYIGNKFIFRFWFGFNTASGKYCCNGRKGKQNEEVSNSFNTASGKYCCNSM